MQFAPSSSELQSQPIATNQQQLQQQQPIREEGGAEGKRKSKGKEAKVKDRSFDTFSELAASNRLPSAPVTFLTGLTLTFICIYFMYVEFDLILFKHYFLTLKFIKKIKLDLYNTHTQSFTFDISIKMISLLTMDFCTTLTFRSIYKIAIYLTNSRRIGIY